MKLPQSDHEQILPTLKIIGEPSRLRILCGLGLECRPVTDIINATGLSQTNVSFHLRVLREAGLVRAERRAAFIYYCLADAELLRILHDLKSWLDAREAPVAGKMHQAAQPLAKRRSAAAKIKEVT